MLGNFPKDQRQRLVWNVNSGAVTDDQGEDRDRDEMIRRRKIVTVKRNDLLTFVVKIQ